MDTKNEINEETENKGKKFTILDKEWAITETENARNSHAIRAGICILGAAILLYTGNQDIENITHFLHPLETSLGSGASGILIGSGIAHMFFTLRYSKKLKKAKQILKDSFENNFELGDDNNAKTR